MNNSKVMAIVAHDAGGADVLSNYVFQNNIECRFVLEGPAVAVFKRRLGAIKISSMKEGLLTCDEVLCGTSWQSDLEWGAIEMAQQLGKKVSTFLDHWVNYPERFVRKGIQHLPDAIWVGDEDAENLVRLHFPNMTIRLVPNPYFIDIQQQIARLAVKKTPEFNTGIIALFVSENISDHAYLRYGDAHYWGYTEFDAIEYFFQNAHVFGEAIRVVIRPHPSDVAGKYDHIIEKHFGLAQLSREGSLLNDIAEADLVVGCQSMAMVIGLLAGKKVVSSIPPGGLDCRLPQTSILSLRKLLPN